MRLNPLLPALLALLPLAAQEKPKEPEGISDNSFLLEEAFNQERGIVQHIFTWQRFKAEGAWLGTFTQEWPMGSQTHQFSFTAPYLHIPGTPNGVGDVALNYRWQALGGDPKDLSFSPRISLLLPTGDEKKGRGAGSLGLQLNLPLSVPVSQQVITHWNAGVTHIPKAKNDLGEQADLAGFNTGIGAIWNLHPEFNLLLEWVHTAQDVVAGPGLKLRETATYLNPGIRWAHNFESGLQIVPGIAYTHGVGASKGDNAVFLYISFEHPIGGR